MAMGAVHARVTDALAAVAEMVAGLDGTDTGADVNEPMNASRFGEPVPASVMAAGVAAFTIALVTVVGVADGFDCRYNAAIPATCGDAIDVPDHVAVVVGLPIIDDVMLTPGAKMSRQVPQLENDARASVEDDAPTVMAEGALDGDELHASALLLPAATTMVMPSATARSTAALSDELNPPPKLMLATAGTPAVWCDTAQSMPATTPLIEPEPVQSRTRTGMSDASFATP